LRGKKLKIDNGEWKMKEQVELKKSRMLAAKKVSIIPTKHPAFVSKESLISVCNYLFFTMVISSEPSFE